MNYVPGMVLRAFEVSAHWTLPSSPIRGTLFSQSFRERELFLRLNVVPELLYQHDWQLMPHLSHHPPHTHKSDLIKKIHAQWEADKLPRNFTAVLIIAQNWTLLHQLHSTLSGEWIGKLLVQTIPLSNKKEQTTDTCNPWIILKIITLNKSRHT